jgi:predicted transcriptional regulator
MKTAISIPDELFRAAEQAAGRLGISRSAFYQRALAAYLDRLHGRLVTEALDATYSAQGEPEPLDTLLERLQTASLPPEEW